MQGTASRDAELSEEPSVSAAVRAIVDACGPRTIVLFGSVARGEARPDSDIDLLVVIDDEADWARAAKAALLAVARLEPEVDVIVTTRARVDANRGQAGTIIRPALREGRVVYERAA
ncbi:MAG: nucleotidyltransferase domain-containing protein [Actinomycetota bacterium]|jgi:predicted nucleotidyltransferase|nr:nucleotidyltransferase domain-containing protein [Actinomycetota bacterium]